MGFLRLKGLCRIRSAAAWQQSDIEAMAASDLPEAACLFTQRLLNPKYVDMTHCSWHAYKVAALASVVERINAETE